MNARANRVHWLPKLLAYCFSSLIVAYGLITWAGSAKTGTVPQTISSSASSRGVEIAIHGGYPELRIDGTPFFIHSAAFHYYRIPRDQWSFLLDRYRDLGINTIDIYIPWNWHEPSEGNFDFDGHSNPRRDLRALLQMIAA
ncbi:MAG TPA: beta-galactosidase, partial [Candidatus Acidoferrales bacterium]|nr:beta-galactosidase [Candidatus Acidoferrales bacterium]